MISLMLGDCLERMKEIPMTEQEFKKQYLCEFKPDPIINEVVALLRYATKQEISHLKRQGHITHKQIVEARLIIEQEAIMTINYTCTSCGNAADVDIEAHEDEQSYYECACGEQMLPTKPKDLDTMNIV